MPDDLRIPELTFPCIQYGAQETQMDLQILLYKGGALSYTKKTKKLIDDGALGVVLPERVELVRRIHDFMSGQLAGGGSRHTAKNNFRGLRDFFGWQDSTNSSASIKNVEQEFLSWTDAMLDRHRVKKDLSMRSAYSIASRVASILDFILERPTSLMTATRLIAPDGRKSAVPRDSEKELLKDTFAFGHLLQDICDGLPSDVVLKAALPVRIILRTGQHIEQWSDFPRKSTAVSQAPLTQAFLAYQNEGVDARPKLTHLTR
ncbi:hypothetical protein [Roseateles puraquae]|uniref:hypothetical protein n=1 Tax=Roseateles puraquae TaxID=431059 RepID=UPI0031D76DEB